MIDIKIKLVCELRRYLWRESPCSLEQCPIYSVQNDLPAVPYLYNGALLAGQTVAV